MKKFRVIALMLVCALLLAACGKKAEKPVGEPVPLVPSVVSSGDSEAKAEELDDYYSKYVTLGEYKGITYTPATVEVTEEDLAAYIDKLLDVYKEKIEITDVAVKEGDDVCMYYEGHIASDDTQFDGGTGTIDSLVIGSGSFIPGFEEQVVGHMPGEDFDVLVTFPEAYRPEGSAGRELNGVEAVFHCNVQYISGGYNYPEKTDEFISANTSYENMAAFETAAKAELTEQKVSEAEDAKTDEIFSNLIDNCTIIELPEEERTTYYNYYVDAYTQEAARYNMDLKSFIEAYYQTPYETFENYVNSYADNMATQAIIFKAIAAKEGIIVSEEEYQMTLSDYYENGYSEDFDTIEEFEAEMGQMLAESMLFSDVMDFVIANAVEN